MSKTGEVKKEHRKVFCGVSRTKQCFKDECDINNIMKKYLKNGKLPDMIKENPIYGDFSKPMDLQNALYVVEKANIQFNNLSSSIRSRFDNDPYKFLQFCDDPNNKSEMAKMGLLKTVVKEEEIKKDEKVADGGVYKV